MLSDQIESDPAPKGETALPRNHLLRSPPELERLRYCCHVDHRVQAEVLRLATLAGRQGKSARIVPSPTHAEIASRVSTHREAVTRVLNHLSRIGLVTRSGDALLVSDVERLAQMVQDAVRE